jgi:type II secretory pathway component PulF
MLDNAMLYVPLWGSLHKTRAKGRFLHVLDQLYDAGIPPEQAWDAACLTARNSAIAGKLRAAKSKVSQNAGINELIAASGVFEPEEAAMVSSGERSGQVNSVLSNMASICEDRAATGKVRNRAASIFLMIIFFGIFAIVPTYIFTRSYGQLLNNIMDYLTKGI